MYHKASEATTLPINTLPLVVQIGFAGARDLFDTNANPSIDYAEFEKLVNEQFQTLLGEGLKALNLDWEFFVCGISSIAIGGDTIFTNACQSLQIQQRIFLPQPREEFLNAYGPKGQDFREEQKAAVRLLLESPHIIHEQVVSDAAERRDRFHDVNLEIVHVSDVLVSLMREDQDGNIGGSKEILQLGEKRKRPVLDIQIRVKDGVPDLVAKWHRLDEFQKPTLPTEIRTATLPNEVVRNSIPTIAEYLLGLTNLAGGHATQSRNYFTLAALVIICAHVFATVFAVMALELTDRVIVSLLGVELFLLLIGFTIHQYLHHTHRVQYWAMSRLCAEVARSVSPIDKFHVNLEYLFTLPFPTVLHPLLRTINVLHLRSSRQWKSEPWRKIDTQKDEGQKKRDEYVEKRLTSREPQAQIAYYEETFQTSGKRLQFARWVFIIASLAAFIATLSKLLSASEVVTVGQDLHDTLKSYLGFCAVVFPVIAVASLSLASAFDLEAINSSSKEMIVFLKTQKIHLENAQSAREYSRLLIETESRLLGETVNWYARRSFLGVS